jgi:hypothetical protein
MADSKRRQWTGQFLRELTLCGDPRLAAERAGVTPGEAWIRRMAEPHFASYWDAALRLRADLVEGILGAVTDTRPPSPHSQRRSPSLRRNSTGPLGPEEPEGRHRPSLRDKEDRQ